jgi:nucleotide-binding universal stress UspA family protein
MARLFVRTLVPLDGSKLAESAVDEAIELVKAAGGELILATVLDGSVFRAFEEFAAVEHISPTEAVDQYLTEITARAADAGVKVRYLHMSDPDPAAGLLRIAENERATAIVITTHGRSGVGRWLLGSVAEKLARGAGCSVLVVRGR